jgi:hypothetical protein
MWVATALIGHAGGRIDAAIGCFGGGRVKPGSLSGRGRSSGAIGIGSGNGVVGGLAGRLALT